MAEKLTQEHVRGLIPKRVVDAHKGTFGRLLILAGSRGMTGAARLAAESAGRAGCGLVTVGTPENVADVVAAGTLESITIGLSATSDGTFSEDACSYALGYAKDMDAVVLGMGITQHPETRRFVHAFLVKCPVPVVVDADGLNCVSTATALLRQVPQPIVITPHPGEMARLINETASVIQSTREEKAKEFATSYKCIVALKGHKTVIATPEGETWINPTGNDGMATGGSGDVLSGILGALIAQGLEPKDATLLSVYLHGLAGDIAAERMTRRGLIARDIIAALPEAWRQLEGSN